MYIGIDMGGTKTRAYQVIVEKNLAVHLEKNLFDVPELLTKSFTSPDQQYRIFQRALSRFGNPGEIVVSTSIAGVANPKTLEATCANIPFPVSFMKDLREKDGYQAFIFNDLYAQARALAMLGSGRNYRTVATLNIGSGNNFGVTRDGVVITEGTEAGHQAYLESGIFCGCGGSGHLESYASGNGARTMAVTYFLNHPNQRDHLILKQALNDWNLEHGKNKSPSSLKNIDFFREIVFYIQGKHVMSAYSKDKFPARSEKRQIQDPQRNIRRLQRNAIAYQLGQITGLFRPDLIILRGSFVTENWEDLGKPAIRRFLDEYERFVHPAIPKPKIERKKLKRDGVIGAVLCAIEKGQ